jgi:hypothetical protein
MKQIGVRDGAPLEIETPHGPVLRVWARTKRDMPADTLRVGALAASILRVRAGQRVAVRRLRPTGQRTIGRT